MAGGRDLSLDRVQTGVGRVLEDVGTEAEVVWGAPVSGDNGGVVRLMLLFKGGGTASTGEAGSNLDLQRV